MKTTEEKARAYNKVRKKIAIRFGSDVADEFFAEFEESEDERVRKALIDFFGNGAKYGLQTNGVYDKDILAWLEKQGQVKESHIFQHEIETCKENNNSLTSEDEKVRKALLELVHDTTGDELLVDYNVHKEEALAWLERQGDYANFRDKIQVGDKVTRNEAGVLVNLSQLNRVAKKNEKQGKQKFEMKTAEESLGISSDEYNKIVDECIFGEPNPTNKVEPKFKVGDKIYLKPEYRMPDDDTPIANTVKEIRRIDDKHYRFDGSYIFIEDQDKYELVEQKPKENKGNIGGISPSWSEEDEPQKELAKSYLTKFDEKFPILPTLKGKQLADYKNFLNKCQQIFGLRYWGFRPLQAKLFEKLSLLWAAWGAEHLQGLGQTDGDMDNEISMWSEEDECYMSECIGAIATKDGWSFDEKRKTKHWLKSLKDRVLLQPKQKWSEDDDNDAWMNDIISKVENNLQLNKAEIDWLKFIKDQVQPKQEWSEEDSFRTETLISVIKSGGSIRPELRNEFVNWLKSLRPQSRWKPSSEQIGLLQAIINEPKNAASESCQIVLREVLEQLKKLKGEV